MAKRNLRPVDFTDDSKRLLSVRLPITILNQISISLANRGLGKKGRSLWFRMAFASLLEMAKNDREGYLGSLNLYNNQSAGRSIQITLNSQGRKAFDVLLDMAVQSAIDQKGIITRLVLMAAHLQLLNEGIAKHKAFSAE
jgi:hypothetical protein